jgi:hypothetical protein
MGLEKQTRKMYMRLCDKTTASTKTKKFIHGRKDETNVNIGYLPVMAA